MKKKIWVPIVSVGVAGSIITPIAVVSATRKTEKTISKIVEKVNNEDIFPNLEVSEFYNFIRYDGEVISFDQSIVNAVFKYVSSNLLTNVDQLDFEYEFKDPSTLKIDFIGKYENNIYTKSYTLKAKM